VKILKSLSIFIILVAMILFISFLDINRKQNNNKIPGTSFYAIKSVEIKDRLSDSPIRQLYENKLSDTVSRGNTLFSILSKNGFETRESNEIIDIISGHISPRKISASAEYAVYYKDGIASLFELQIDPLKKIRVRKNPEGLWEHSIIEQPLLSKEIVISGTIDSSLYNAIAEKEGIGVLAIELSDIYAFDIDFFSDIRVNDLFIVIVDKTYMDTEFYRYEKIKACGMYANKKIYKAFFFDDDEYRGYYNDMGQSLEKDFLKAPLNYRRISSHFSRSRFHPVLKRYAAHNGIDYAAPHGTPVVALGDGKISRAGWNGGLGNYIEIKHNRVYSTGYGHLSRFAKNIKKGVNVRKGDLIGYVGSTGLSTGPHLDFRVIKNGHFINPLSLQPNRKIDLKGEILDRYLETIKDMDSRLDVFFTSSPGLKED